MRFVIFRGESSISDLANRIFGIPGTGSQTSTNQAAANLLKANPHLADLSKVAVGSLVAVPDNAPAISPGQQAVASSGMRSLVAQTMQSALETMQQRLTDIESSAASRLKSAMDRIQTTDFKTALASLSDQSIELAGQMPDLDTVAKGTEAVMNDLQAAQDLRKQSLAQLQAALASYARK